MAGQLEKRGFGRRSVMAGGLAAVGLVGTGFAAAPVNPFTALETQIGGLVGVGAIDTGTGRFVGHWPNFRFAMCSTFKWLLAAQCLARADAGDLRMDETLRFGAADLLDYAPVTKANVEKGEMSIVALCRAMVEVSDNTAANLLLARLGGPPAFTAFCRSIGDTMTRLDRNEPSLNTNLGGDQRDTTTPRAMAETMRAVLTGDVLTLPSRDALARWMMDAKTGFARLRAGLPKDWRVGDKTGTGQRGAVNDVAIAWPPGKAPIVMAVYLSGSRADAETLNAAHAQIARLIIELLGSA